MKKFLTVIGLALACIASASAMPGQSLDAFQKWARGNTVLHSVGGESALDGSVSFATSFQAGRETAQFKAISDIAETRIVKESMVYSGPDDYRLDQHRETAGRLLSAVYGREVADDFRDAPITTTGYGDLPTVAYRGKLFGYELSGNNVVVRVLADFDIDLVCIEANNCPIGD